VRYGPAFDRVYPASTAGWPTRSRPRALVTESRRASFRSTYHFPRRNRIIAALSWPSCGRGRAGPRSALDRACGAPSRARRARRPGRVGDRQRGAAGAAARRGAGRHLRLTSGGSSRDAPPPGCAPEARAASARRIGPRLPSGTGVRITGSSVRSRRHPVTRPGRGGCASLDGKKHLPPCSRSWRLRGGRCRGALQAPGGDRPGAFPAARLTPPRDGLSIPALDGACPRRNRNRTGKTWRRTWSSSNRRQGEDDQQVPGEGLQGQGLDGHVRDLPKNPKKKEDKD